MTPKTDNRTTNCLFLFRLFQANRYDLIRLKGPENVKCDLHYGDLKGEIQGVFTMHLILGRCIL